MTVDKKLLMTALWFAGIIAIILSAGSLVMLWAILVESRGKTTIDPAVVALFGTLTTLTANSLGTIGLVFAFKTMTSDDRSTVTTSSTTEVSTPPASPEPPPPAPPGG